METNPEAPKASCSRCGQVLYRIDFVEPDWEGQFKSGPRPPLCEPCWRKADADWREACDTRR